MAAHASRSSARLRWQCRRGLRELDVLLIRYLDRRFEQADARERAAFERLLDLQDPQIMALVIGRDVPADSDLANVLARLTQPHD
jgi:antitoxin CptB